MLNATQPSDLRKFGLIPEFIGRFPVLAPLEPLDVDSLIQVLTEPKNALVRQYQQLFAYEGVELKFEQDALVEIAKKAIERETGSARFTQYHGTDFTQNHVRYSIRR